MGANMQITAVKNRTQKKTVTSDPLIKEAIHYDTSNWCLLRSPKYLSQHIV